MKSKKPVIRSCSCCRQKALKQDLFRIVRLPDGTAAFDRFSKLSGRGAYLCRSAKCIERARKSNAVGHSLNCIIPDTVWNSLITEIG